MTMTTATTTMVTTMTAMQRHVSFVPLPLTACPLSCPTHPSLPQHIVSFLNTPPLFLCKSRCYAQTLGTFLLALWRSDCLLYGYGIVRMRVAIPGTLRFSSCLYAYL